MPVTRGRARRPAWRRSGASGNRVAAELRRGAPVSVGELALGGQDVMALLPGHPREAGRRGAALPPGPCSGRAGCEHETQSFRALARLVGRPPGRSGGSAEALTRRVVFGSPRSASGLSCPPARTPHHGPAHPLHRERPSLPRARPAPARGRGLRRGRGLLGARRNPARADAAAGPGDRRRPSARHRRRRDREPPEAGAVARPGPVPRARGGRRRARRGPRRRRGRVPREARSTTRGSPPRSRRSWAGGGSACRKPGSGLACGPCRTPW